MIAQLLSENTSHTSLILYTTTATVVSGIAGWEVMAVRLGQRVLFLLCVSALFSLNIFCLVQYFFLPSLGVGNFFLC